ncbi:MAG: NAD(P)/FAD-dependent oxidoreductase [Planctomycetota bacterium]
MNRASRVLIVGGGLAGLAAALELQRNHVPFTLFEASDRLGGRLRTELHEGFRIDRGFQVLQTAYPEAQRQLDYAALRLSSFLPGALVRARGRFVEMSDPWRRPGGAIQTLFNGIGTLGDRWRLARLRSQLRRLPLETIYTSPDQSTEEFLLHTWGFSRDLVDRFFRPWFSGVFLESRLDTSARFFQFVFKMLAAGTAALPSAGMEAIPRQLADKLPPHSLRIQARVQAVEREGILLASGERVAGKHIVLATEGSTAARLLVNANLPDMNATNLRPVRFQSTVNFTYAADQAPLRTKLLVLNGELSGPIAHLSIPSNIAPSYAPSGQALISVTAMTGSSLDAESLLGPVRTALREWFGRQVDNWRPLAQTWVAEAIPQQMPGEFHPADRQYRLGAGLFRCGDYLGTASINGALLSGREAATELVQELST